MVPSVPPRETNNRGVMRRFPQKPKGGESMKRRQFLKAASVGVAAAAVASPAIAQTMPELKWRMTTSWPKSLDTLFGGAELMAKAVAEATDNKFQIQVFAGGVIVPAFQGGHAGQHRT